MGGITAGKERYIGVHEGERGPLVIALGGVHGNEPAGIEAMKMLFKMLEAEPKINPGFAFKGRLVGLLGNLSALKVRQRFIDADLNRQWTAEHIQEILQKEVSLLNTEEREVLGLLQTIHSEIEHYRPGKVVLLDLHTTSAEDGIFTIPTESRESYDLAMGLYTPVILNLTDTLHGTIMQYFDKADSRVPTVAVSFESGKHEDPLSINRAIAAVVNCLRFEGMVRPEDVESRHDDILRYYTGHLPRLTRMAYKHPLQEGEPFKMKPGFRNFSPVEKGQYLADSSAGKVLAPLSGYLLMPLYQSKGSEGFFIVVDVSQSAESKKQTHLVSSQ